MKIALTVGHSLLKNGCYTSADGKTYGGCNEYKWCKAFSKQLASALKKNGHKVKRIVCPEKKFTCSTQEKNYKLNLINRSNYDLVIELHLNAASPSARGTEVLYKSPAYKKICRKGTETAIFCISGQGYEGTHGFIYPQRLQTSCNFN